MCNEKYPQNDLKEDEKNNLDIIFNNFKQEFEEEINTYNNVYENFTNVKEELIETYIETEKLLDNTLFKNKFLEFADLVSYDYSKFNPKSIYEEEFDFDKSLRNRCRVFISGKDFNQPDIFLPLLKYMFILAQNRASKLNMLDYN
jgi:hypothetical protein